MWGEPASRLWKLRGFMISTHSPRVGRTVIPLPTKSLSVIISTHSPRVGRTFRIPEFDFFGWHFNSLAPCGANRDIRIQCNVCNAFQLTRPVWGEPIKPSQNSRNLAISTHSPRVGRTQTCLYAKVLSENFNSLAPCGANLPNSASQGKNTRFQLTRPVWGEPPSVHC